PKDLEDLGKALSGENEDMLLSRKYGFESEEDGGWISTTRGSVVEYGLKQLQLYMDTIALRKLQYRNASGVPDSRVSVDIELGKLQGYVVIVVMGSRVFVRTAEPI
ncbi:hypothetical protein BGZ80_011673, partial [Entomortierella chlamydospora]